MGSAWKAIADDNRREVLLMLKKGEKTPTEMASHFDFSLPALSTHLRVLKDADLVRERKEGQKRFYSIRPEGLGEVREFLDSFWDDRLDRLRRHVESGKRR